MAIDRSSQAGVPRALGLPLSLARPTNRWTRAAEACFELTWRGGGRFDSRRRVNSNVRRYDELGDIMTFKQAIFLSIAGLAAIVAVPTLIFGLMYLDESALHPSDQYLEKMFLAHEADFNKLVEMSNADSHVVRIAPDFTWL